jgi:hypothetical protein
LLRADSDCDSLSLSPHQVVCEPAPPAVFDAIEVACIALFTLDYGTRALLAACMPPRWASRD